MEVSIPVRRTSQSVRGATSRATNRERMLHIRVGPELHRALRVIVAEQDTTLQEWVVRTLADAVRKAGAPQYPSGSGGG